MRKYDLLRRLPALLLALLLLLTACAAPEKAPDPDPDPEPEEHVPTWQEQFDLAVRYLSEGNYQEAIIAFTAAIQIDPRPEAYVGRAQAYVLSGETQEHLASALADYESALELDDSSVDAWLGLADVYIRMGDYTKALEVLQEALEKTDNDPAVADKLREVESGLYVDSKGNIRRSSSYNKEGILESYTEYHYDELGRRSSWENYTFRDDDGELQDTARLENRCEVTFDEKNLPQRYQFYGPDGQEAEHDTFVYNEAGQKTEQHRYDADGSELVYFLYYYDDQGREEKYERYEPNGSLTAYWVYEYDENGNAVGETRYDSHGQQIGYEVYEG